MGTCASAEAAGTASPGMAGGAEQADNTKMLSPTAATTIVRSTCCIRSSHCSHRAGWPRAIVAREQYPNPTYLDKVQRLPGALCYDEAIAGGRTGRGAALCMLTDGFIG